MISTVEGSRRNFEQLGPVPGEPPIASGRQMRTAVVTILAVACAGAALTWLAHLAFKGRPPPPEEIGRASADASAKVPSGPIAATAHSAQRDAHSASGSQQKALPDLVDPVAVCR